MPPPPPVKKPAAPAKTAASSEPEVVQSPGYTKFRSVFNKMGKPGGLPPTFPKKLSSVTSDDLADMTAVYQAWREFSEDMHFEATQDKLTLQDKYDFEYAKLFVVADGGGVNEKKYAVVASDKLQNIRTQLLDADIYLTMVSNKLESFNNSLAVLSREVTRRSNFS
jgi:hypothetical protein